MLKHDAGATIRKGYAPNCGPNGSGFTTWTAHASATCGTGKVVDGPRAGWGVSFCDTCMFHKSVTLDGPYGGSDGFVTIQQTGPATYAVFAYSHVAVDDAVMTTTRHADLAAAKADANGRYRAIKASRAARTAASEARRAARQAS